jgi:hypothetical protein
MRSAPALLSDYLTLRDVSQRLGASYATAYSLGASGMLGEPVIIGRTQFFPRAVAEGAITHRRQQLAAGGSRASVMRSV